MYDAASISPLDFTLRPHLDVVGTIPDPTDAQVRAFNAALSRILGDAAKALDELGGDDEGEPRDDSADYDRAEEIDRKAHEESLDAVAQLCSGTPTREQLAELPFRVQRGFIDWLRKELANPTTLPATKPSLAAVR